MQAVDDATLAQQRDDAIADAKEWMTKYHIELEERKATELKLRDAEGKLFGLRNDKLLLERKTDDLLHALLIALRLAEDSR